MARSTSMAISRSRSPRSARTERSPGWCNWSSWRANRKGDINGWPTGSSRRFVPAVSAIALLAFGVHWAFGSLERGLWTGLAVTLIACPCALGLAAPLAVWSALGNAAGQRVLFRSGEALERLAEIAAIRFDKTGTLTTGSAAVAECVVEHADDLEKRSRARATLAAASSHAMSRGIVEFARARQIAPSAMTS